VSTSRPLPSIPSTLGAPVNPERSRWRSSRCTAGVHGPGRTAHRGAEPHRPRQVPATQRQLVVGHDATVARPGVRSGMEQLFPMWISRRVAPDLDERKATCLRRWGLRRPAALEGGFRSHLCECLSAGGEAVVLKLTVTLEEAALEARALELWRGTGAAVRLLDADLEHGGLLLERLRPASHLHGGDSTVIEVVVDLMGRLHSVGAVDGFPSLAELYPHLAAHSIEDNAYERATRGEPSRAAPALELMAAAGESAERLLSSAPVQTLLHGDLLDKNLLRHGERYVAVDPIPRIGEPASEIGFYACDHPPVRTIFTRASRIAEHLGADADRAVRWAAVWTVLLATSAWRADQDALDALVSSHEFGSALRW
jgi:streptomycin 6-kinase